MVVVHSPNTEPVRPGLRSDARRVERILARRSRDRVGGAATPGNLDLARRPHRDRAGRRRAQSQQMVRAADDSRAQLSQAAAADVTVNTTGASAMWSDFNTANRTAMMRSELFSWPVTLAILVLAFGSLVAAGLPLMLTIIGLVASAGVLYLGTQVADISIWAMNFALMFALALGIDYALFIVARFRGALFGAGLSPVEAAAETMDTAGKAVLFSGLTVLISLTAVMLVPSPAFRSMALGIMVSVIFVLAATLTLLPAVLGKLGPRVDRLRSRWVHSGEHRSPRFAAWAERLWRHPYAFGGAALAILLALAVPVFGLRTGMPSIKVVPTGDTSRVGYTQVQQAFGAGAPGALQIVTPALERAAASPPPSRPTRASPQVMPAQTDRAGGARAGSGHPQRRPVRSSRRPDHRPAALRLPPGALVGGSVGREPRPREPLSPRPRRWSSASSWRSASCCCSSRCRRRSSPLVGVLTNLLATGAAFGVARLIFQDGHGTGLLGFESQGFLDAWGPVFFFAMIFAISMDYTVFLLSSAKEHWDRIQRPARGDDRRRRALRPRDLRRRGGDGRRVLHLRALRPAAAQGDGRHPRRRRPARRAPRPAAAHARALRLLGKWAWWLPRWADRLLPDVRFGHA